ncbi:MAG: hypothetical protein JRE23_15715 [Deltaproteobacteria bacterium]|nr:hypothetical protein [Deltaproteobacteria bacterium]
MATPKGYVELAREFLDNGSHQDTFRLVSDTTDYFKVENNDIVVLEDIHYLIRGYEREGRAGLEDPKYWVKKAIELDTGRRVIMKLTFYENFVSKIGNQEIIFFRSPQKEARVLRQTRDNPHFMHGISVRDSEGNLLRIVDRIPGPALGGYLDKFSANHKTYLEENFPDILKKLIEAYRAMGYLHSLREVHGDIRSDHILVDSTDGLFKWIDFDYNYKYGESIYGIDLFEMGCLLTTVAARGFSNLYDLVQLYPDILDRLVAEDMNILYKNRIANLKKVYPYIPDRLNLILLRFSAGAEVFYDTTEELVSDMEEALEELS